MAKEISTFEKKKKIEKNFKSPVFLENVEIEDV